jgi:hypothetical protein
LGILLGWRWEKLWDFQWVILLDFPWGCQWEILWESWLDY